jgi:hypothetical protein
LKWLLAKFLSLEEITASFLGMLVMVQIEQYQLRELLAEYLSNVRGLVNKIFSIVTGVEGTTPDSWTKVLRKPGDLVALEMKWLRHIVTAVRVIGRYVRQLQRWRKHLDNFSSNLNLTEDQKNEVFFKGIDAIIFLEEKDFSFDYLSWVIADAMTELAQLVDQSEEVASGVPRLLEGAKELESEYLVAAVNIAKNMPKDFRNSIYETLHEALAKAYETQNLQEAKRWIANYLSSFSRLLKTIPFFIGTDLVPMAFETEGLEHKLDLFTSFSQWENIVEELVETREKIYNAYIQHEISVFNAILPSDTNIAKWLREFRTIPDQPVTRFLPDEFDRELILLGVSQAITYLLEVNERISAVKKMFADLNQVPFLKYLNSPRLEQFYAAEIDRIKLFSGYADNLLRMLHKIQLHLKE